MPAIDALPYEYAFDPARTALIVIDMQRDFIEPGGFGEALGNDVRLLSSIVPTVARLLAACRGADMTIIHTREANDRGYECLLIEDATESYFPAFKQAALEMIRAQGAIVGSTAPLAAFTAAL